MLDNEIILIVDYGSQYTQLIARKIREQNVYCLVHPYNSIGSKVLINKNLSGIILSGGPNSVNDKKSPKLDEKILSLKIPVLGICYGLQLLCKEFGGKIEQSSSREYGHSLINHKNNPQSSNVIELLKNLRQYELIVDDHFSYNIKERFNNEKINKKIEINLKKIVDIVLCVQPPNEKFLSNLKPGTFLVGLLNPYGNKLLAEKLKSKNISAIALELLPRISRAQSSDALSSQANIAGYKSVLLAASALDRYFPMLMTAAGTIQPSKLSLIHI